MSEGIITRKVAGPIAFTPAMSLQKFLTIEVVVSTLISGALGALFGWIGTRGDDHVPFLGAGGTVIDILMTSFFTGFLLTLILTLFLRMRIRKGGLPNIAADRLPALLRLLPQNVFLRGGVMGLIGLVIIAPLIMGLFGVTGTADLSRVDFVWIKGVYGAALGAVFTTLVLVLTLAENVE